MIARHSVAQIDTSFNKKIVPYVDYLSLVGKNNLLYAAEKFNVSIAEAGIEIAKIFPNPQLYYGYFDNGQNRMKMGSGVNSAIKTYRMYTTLKYPGLYIGYIA